MKTNILLLASMVLLSSHSTLGVDWVVDGYIDTPRNQFAGCVIGGSLYVFGGNTHGGANLNSLEVYDTSTHTASYGTSHPTHWLEELSGVEYQGDFYMFGAYGEAPPDEWFSRPRNIALKYETDGTWTELPARPDTGSASKCAVLYNDEIYIFGGYTTNSIDSTKVHAYNPGSNTWRYVTDVPEVLHLPGVAQVGSKVYLIGGYAGDSEGSLVATQFLNSVMSYDLETDIWTQDAIAPLPGLGRVFVYGHTLPVIDNKIYCMGGYTSDGGGGSVITNTVSVFDLDTGSWTLGPELPYDLGGYCALQYADSVYVIGGTVIPDAGPDYNDIVTSTVLRLDVADPGSEGALRIDEINVESNAVSIIATNTRTATRYALQSSSNLVDWGEAQYRLARKDSQSFEHPLSINQDKIFYRVAEKQFRTQTLAGPWVGYGLFVVPTNDPYSSESAWVIYDIPYDINGYGISSSVQTSFDVPLAPWTNNAVVASDGSYLDSWDFKGLMALDQDMHLITAGDDLSGWLEVDLLLRSGGTNFSTADLSGDWNYFILFAMKAQMPTGWIGWVTGEASFSTNGAITWLSALSDDGDTSLPPPADQNFSVLSNGSIISGYINHPNWKMSLDKNMLLYSFTTDEGGAVGLGVMSRSGGTGFDNADLEGRWKLFVLTLDGLSFKAILDFADDGTGTWLSIERSNGDNTIHDPPLALSVADDGSITDLDGDPSAPDWQMSLDKDTVIFVGAEEEINMGVMLRN